VTLEVVQSLLEAVGLIKHNDC